MFSVFQITIHSHKLFCVHWASLNTGVLRSTIWWKVGLFSEMERKWTTLLKPVNCTNFICLPLLTVFFVFVFNPAQQHSAPIGALNVFWDSDVHSTKVRNWNLFRIFFLIIIQVLLWNKHTDHAQALLHMNYVLKGKHCKKNTVIVGWTTLGL